MRTIEIRVSFQVEVEEPGEKEILILAIPLQDAVSAGLKPGEKEIFFELEDYEWLSSESGVRVLSYQLERNPMPSGASETVEVIDNSCVWDKQHDCWRVTGEAIRTTYASLELARPFADAHRHKGRSVIIRPSYNEPDEGSKAQPPWHYREWRSFNGEDFKEVRFSI